MTYEVQQTRWDRIVRRVSGSIGHGSRVSETISELFPVMDIERVPGELLVLGGTHICNGAASVAGAAGEVPNVSLFNPIDSNTLLTITQIAIRVDSLQRVRIAFDQTSAGARVNTERFREGRLITATNLPVGQVFTFSNPSQAAQQVELGVGDFNSLILKDENSMGVLSPDTKCTVAGTIVATTIRVTFWWRERPAEQAELQF